MTNAGVPSCLGRNALPNDKGIEPISIWNHPNTTYRLPEDLGLNALSGGWGAIHHCGLVIGIFIDALIRVDSECMQRGGWGEGEF